MATGVDRGTTGVRRVSVRGPAGRLRILERAPRGPEVAAVPSRLLTVRFLEFPFSDLGKIHAVLPQELTGSLPFPLEECRYDFSPGSGGRGLAVVALKKALEAWQGSPAAGGPAPPVLDAEPLAYARALGACGIRDALVVDLGAGATTFCVVQEAQVRFLRVVLRGQEAFTGALARKRSLPKEEAEALKIRRGVEEEAVRQALVEAVEDAGLPRLLPPRVCLVGGGCRLPGVEALLTEILERPAAPLDLPGPLRPERDAVAFGAALQGILPPEGVNLAARPRHSEIRWKPWAAAAALVVALYSANLWSRADLLEARQRSLQQALRTTLTREFPRIPDSGSPADQLAALVEKERRSAPPAAGDVLETLLEAARALPGRDVALFDVEYSQQEVRLRGEASSVGSVERLQESLRRHFPTVKIQETRTAPSGRVMFLLRFQEAAP